MSSWVISGAFQPVYFTDVDANSRPVGFAYVEGVANVTITLTSIGSLATFGQPSLGAITLSSIGSLATFGTPTVTLPGVVTLSSIGALASLGSLILSAPVTMHGLICYPHISRDKKLSSCVGVSMAYGVIGN